jgi:HEAT repeat protein
MIEWMNDLKSKDSSVLTYAVANLKFYEQEARDASRDIIKLAMQMHDNSLKVNAIIALGWIGFHDSDMKEGINLLIKGLNDPQEIVRYQAAMALRRQAANAYPATAALIGALRNPNSNSWEVRRAAAATLGIVARQNPVDKGFDRGAFSALVDSLNDSAAEVRMEATISLIRFGQPGLPADRNRERQALNTLTASSRQPPKVSIWAHVALFLLERGGTPNSKVSSKVGQQHLTAITRFLPSTDLQTQEHAVRALGVIGPDAGAHVPDLIRVLDDKNLGVVVLACIALSSMGNVAKQAVQKLETMSQRHPDPDVRDTAQQAADKIKESHRR